MRVLFGQHDGQHPVQDHGFEGIHGFPAETLVMPMPQQLVRDILSDPPEGERDARCDRPYRQASAPNGEPVPVVAIAAHAPKEELRFNTFMSLMTAAVIHLLDERISVGWQR